MLYLYEPQQIAGATVYPDSLEDHIFYVIPPMPRFRRTEDGNPVFQLLKFRGGEASDAPQVELPTETGGESDTMPANSVPTIDGEVAGGFLIFDTEYSVDLETEEQIRQALDQQVRDRYARQGRTLPEGFQIVLRQPQWTDGTVEILMEDTANGLFESVSKTGKPSLMGNNVSSFAIALRPWQATLIEQAITPPADFSPIQVNYNLKFLAKLPPVSINIYASAYDSYNMYKEYGSHPNKGACSNRDKVVRAITERVFSRDVVRITIDSGGLTMNDETFQALRDMAMGLVQQWIQQEFLKAPPERATQEELQNFTLKELHESDFRDFILNINQSASVEIPVHPQGTLETLIKDGDDLAQFVTEVDLSLDEFYQNREVSVKVYADFPAPEAEPKPSDLLFVEVALRYGDAQVKSMTWDAQGTGVSLANGERWNVDWHKIPDVNNIEWEARVCFRDTDREYLLTGVTDKTQLNIAVPVAGRAVLQLIESGVPWDVIQHVEVTVDYSDASADPQRITKMFLFNETVDQIFFDEVIWTERKEPFFVKLEYRLKNDNVIPSELTRVDQDMFIVDSPFKEWLNVPIRAKWTTPDWDEDIINLEYRDGGNGYVRLGQIHLSEEGGWAQQWAVPLLNTAVRQFRYKWMRRNKEGGIFTSADVPGNPADGWLEATGNEIIYTGDDIGEDMLRVSVDPLIFLWGIEGYSDVLKAIVHMRYEPAPGLVDVDDHSFNPGDTAWTWKQHTRHPARRNFKWSATYYTKPFSRIEIGPFESEGESIVLTPPE